MKAIDKTLEYMRNRHQKRYFSKSKYLWLKSLWEDKPDGLKEISKADYNFIQSCYSKNLVSRKPLTDKQMTICNKIYERYQSVDVRK